LPEEQELVLSVSRERYHALILELSVNALPTKLAATIEPGDQWVEASLAGVRPESGTGARYNHVAAWRLDDERRRVCVALLCGARSSVGDVERSVCDGGICRGETRGNRTECEKNLSD
jgi:hypothetical protein